MLPDRVSNPGPLTYESGALPIALRGPADRWMKEDPQCNALFVELISGCHYCSAGAHQGLPVLQIRRGK